MFTHFSIGKVVALALNVAILIYLVYRRIEDRPSLHVSPSCGEVRRGREVAVALTGRGR